MIVKHSYWDKDQKNSIEFIRKTSTLYMQILHIIYSSKYIEVLRLY